MKKIFSILVLLTAMGCGMAWSQDTVRINSATQGSITDADGGDIIVRDDDSQGAGAPFNGFYEIGRDRYVTIKSGCTAPARYSFRVNELQVSCLDTIYVYDGTDTNGTLIVKFNSHTGNVAVGDVFFETPANTTGMMTVRFRTDPRADTSRTRLPCASTSTKGFQLTFSCGKPCEDIVPIIDSKFYRTRNGVIYDSAYSRMVTEYDTVWDTTIVGGQQILSVNHVDTVSFLGMHLCLGDGAIFMGHGQYTHRHGYYNPSDATTKFTWDMDNEGDSIVGVGMNRITYNDYQQTTCFDMALTIEDVFGCVSGQRPSVRIRTALNPIKTIFTLDEICSDDSLKVNMGYGDDDATLTLRRIVRPAAIAKTNEIRTFIPDGCSCGSPSYYEAPVLFTEFPNTRTVESASDICSICINMEHSFVGDFFMSIVCPSNQEAVLKFGSRVLQNCNFPTFPLEEPNPSGPGTETGGGTVLGFPLDAQYINISGVDNEPKCDSLQNPYGIGLDYCFTRDRKYTLITGESAGDVWSATTPHPAGHFYISPQYAENTVTLPVTFDPIPAGFAQAGQTPQPTNGTTMTTKKPSNHAEMTDYYLPWTTFKELIGCPLNGTWKIRIYDTYGIDNGWIFNWSLDICDLTPGDCDYQVPIDSLVWSPDTSAQYHDYDMGHYRGVVVNAASPTVSYISSPDTAGTFPIIVRVYDAFGCEWDTTTSITSIWTPEPDLGPDTSLCGVDRMMLDAKDRHTESQKYSYLWHPYGQNTDTITTAEGVSSEVTYVVSVTNTQPGKACTGRDTIVVGNRRQPMPAFIPTPFTFEGCDPFTLSFDNRSIDAVEHLWVFGDGITSTEPSPTHTYGAGIYDLRYYATSADGCIDSIVSPQSIAVYTSPKAGFSWTPVYPSVANPVATFTNLTEPRTPDNKYFWEIQYNINNPLSVETLLDESPQFDFSQWTDEDPSGNYAVRLIARTDNHAPSGNIVYCRDTAENTILVVNDFLQFPNVVSPNGDGINDRFVIKNLVEGMGYPINQLDIYNKWGAHVYHKENISRDEDFWDPQHMPAGTYFYRFSARGYNGNVEHNGAIEVVK